MKYKNTKKRKKFTKVNTGSTDELKFKRDDLFLYIIIIRIKMFNKIEGAV